MTIEFTHYDIQQTSEIKKITGIIFKTEKQAEIAKKIVEILKERGEIYDSDMKELARNASCSEKWFYSRILRNLIKLGMVRKDLNRYFLSNDFANALRRFERSWRDIV